MHRGVIDIGNTRIKCAIFNAAGEITAKTTLSSLDTCRDWLVSQGVSRAMASSVSRKDIPAMEGIEVLSLTRSSKILFTNLYKTPETLGADRIAAMAAASAIYPGKAVLVFDIGTCMTIDMMHPGNLYKGGNISPGLDMRLKAMHEMTGRLPYASTDDFTVEAGNTTLSALANGALTGMRYEMEGYIRHYQALYPELITVLCGGDISHFDKQLKFKIFAAPDFVLQGLYHLLLFNEL